MGGSPNTPASNQLHVGLGSGAHSGVVRARAAASRDRVGLAGVAGVPSVSKEVSSKPGFVDAACQYSASRLAAAARRQEEEQQQHAEEDSTAAAAAGAGSLVDAGVGGDEYAYADDGGDDYGGAGGDDDFNFDGSLGQQQEAEEGQDAAAAAGSSEGGAADASPAPRLPGTSAVGLEQQHDADGNYDMQGNEAGELLLLATAARSYAWRAQLGSTACVTFQPCSVPASSCSSDTTISESVSKELSATTACVPPLSSPRPFPLQVMMARVRVVPPAGLLLEPRGAGQGRHSRGAVQSRERAWLVSEPRILQGMLAPYTAC